MATYAQSIDLLMNRLPMFARVGSEAIKKGLHNIIALSEALGQPHQKFKSVHIAGTNGKGSTSHLLAAALQGAGYKTGLYTSPHLVDLRERIRINGEPVSEDFVVRFVDSALPFIDRIKPSYFELNVAMAFQAFAEEGVDIAVVETGLGGRLDSTNILLPELSVITNIGLDHTQILGDTLAEIALEKAGIIKAGVPVVIGETHHETEQVFFLEAHKKKSTILFADTVWELVRTGQDKSQQHFKAINKATQQMYNLDTDLLGNYQAHNFITALAACDALGRQGWRLEPGQVMRSWTQVKKATGLRGRWDWVQDKPSIILDVAHNPPGMSYLLDNLQQVEALQEGAQLHIICGFVKDKDVDKVLQLLPENAHYYFTQAAVPRALPVEDLLRSAGIAGLAGAGFVTVAEALQAAQNKAGEKDILLVTGSFFIVGEAITVLDRKISIPM